MDISNESVHAAIIALALGLLKVVEILVGWIVKKFNHGDKAPTAVTIVQLDPEASRMIRETNEMVADIHSAVDRTDPDGSLLIYGPRGLVHDALAALGSIDSKIDTLGKQNDEILRIVIKKD